MLEPQAFSCPRCGENGEVFYSNKTGDRIAWRCGVCGGRGYFKGTIPNEKPVIIAS